MYSESRLFHGAALWRSINNMGGTVVSADGCVDLIVREGRMFVAGPSTRRILSEGDGENGSFGFRLPPGRAGHLLNLGLNEIADQLVPLEDLVQGARANLLRDAMIPLSEGFNSTIALTSIAVGAAGASHWPDAVRCSAAGAVSAGSVVAELGGSERSFRRRMLGTFGYGYATLVRLERARHAQGLLRRGFPIGAAAAVAGFADQSHLSREFQRLVGMSPGQFVASSA